jgi:hypothetical protein
MTFGGCPLLSSERAPIFLMGEHFYYEQVLDLVRTFLLQLLKGLYDFSSIAFGVVDWIN